ncbi:MAG: exosortase-associated EpsI family protein [Phycisphaerales bacterium]|nr:exosortase-associated EpsI family protein [Phycisphaerales bacterium]
MSKRAQKASKKHSGNRGTILAPVIAGCVMLGATIGISSYIKFADLHMQKIPIYPKDNRQVSAIPIETENWVRLGSDRISSSEIVEVMGTENYLSRDYIRKDSMDTDNPIVVEVHAAYYTGMIDTVPHVPERCFVGGGMQQSESSRNIQLPMDTSNWRPDRSVEESLAGVSGTLYTTRLSNNRSYTDAPGIRVRLPRDVTPENPLSMRCSEFLIGDGRKIYAGYFFIANGGTKANANEVRTLAFNLSDDYAYYMKVQVNCVTAESMDEFVEYSGQVLSELIGELMRCTPDWVEVQRGNYPEDNVN